MAKNKSIKAVSYHHGNIHEESIKWGLSFLEKGKPDFSLREIAQKIGVTHGALNRHFGSKDGLLAQIAEEGFKHFNNYLEKSTHSGTLNEQFYEMARSYIRFSLDYPYHYRLMLGGKIPDHDKFEGMKEQGERAFNQLLGLIEKMQNEKIISMGDPLNRAYAVWSGVHGLVMLATEGYMDFDKEENQSKTTTSQATLELSLEVVDIFTKSILSGFK
jgi:AcrR family transcriptional regulator